MFLPEQQQTTRVIRLRERVIDNIEPESPVAEVRDEIRLKLCQKGDKDMRLQFLPSD